ncbi:MAG: DUF937 domain-containing protein [Rhodomicrobium sp.]|nr:DUF937 domain-containing protein [Rhodomicrobium sp.]
MSINLVSAITQYLSTEAAGKIASSFELEQAAVQKGISAAIPGILASLANAASSPDGAQRLGTAVSQLDDMPPSGIVNSILSSDHKQTAETGLSLISSLIGGSSLEILSTAIAQYAGFSQGSAKRLLGFLAPLVLRFLRREQVQAGLDARGLASLLASQRENIERAMPAGAGRRFQDIDVRPVSQPASRRRPAGGTPGSPPQSWACWLLPALILAGAVLYLLPSPEEQQSAEDNNKQPAGETVQVAPASQREQQPVPVPATTAPAINLAATLENDIVANISRLRASLQNVKDPASAQAALTELQDISMRFGQLKAAAQQLPPESRKALAAAVASRVPDLNGLIDRISNDANLSGAAKPAMDSLKSGLLGISKA